MFRTLTAALLLSVTAIPASAQISWESATELSYVSTGGNAQSSTFGLKASLTGAGAPNGFKIEVGGIRASADKKTRRATGSPGDFVVTETSQSELTASSYFARGRYDRTLDGAFAFTGIGWERNRFAGVENRYSAVAGLGRTWIDGETGRVKTDLGVTYTVQKDVEPAPGADESFAGARLTIDATRTLTETADFASTLIADQNLEQQGDFRADWTNSVTASISEGLALKTSLQLLYDNEPALVSVPLFDPTGAATGQNVQTRGEKLDRVLTVALVVRL